MSRIDHGILMRGGERALQPNKVFENSRVRSLFCTLRICKKTNKNFASSQTVFFCCKFVRWRKVSRTKGRPPNFRTRSLFLHIVIQEVENGWPHQEMIIKVIMTIVEIVVFVFLMLEKLWNFDERRTLCHRGRWSMATTSKVEGPNT